MRSRATPPHAAPTRRPHDNPCALLPSRLSASGSVHCLGCGVTTGQGVAPFATERVSPIRATHLARRHMGRRHRLDHLGWQPFDFYPQLIGKPMASHPSATAESCNPFGSGVMLNPKRCVPAALAKAELAHASATLADFESLLQTHSLQNASLESL